MLTANYHTHTFRCGHASGREEDYIEAAIARGLKVLGFSDHAPYLFFDRPDYYSTFRMRPEAAEEYVQTIKALRQIYQEKIKLPLGYEIEYYPKYFGKTEEYLRSLGYDYLILGQHFPGNEIGERYAAGRCEDPKQLADYTDQVIEAIGTGFFLYVAHPDIFNFAGDPAVYKKEIRRLCRAAADRNVPLEINLLGLAEKRNYPNPAFWEIAGEEGVTAVIGMDAHSVNAIRDMETEMAAAALAERFHVRLEIVSVI